MTNWVISSLGFMFRFSRSWFLFMYLIWDFGFLSLGCHSSNLENSLLSMIVCLLSLFIPSILIRHVLHFPRLASLSLSALIVCVHFLSHKDFHVLSTSIHFNPSLNEMLISFYTNKSRHAHFTLKFYFFTHFHLLSSVTRWVTGSPGIHLLRIHF